MCMNPCLGCKDRYVRYDENGKAHTCHAECARHAEHMVLVEKIRQKKIDESRVNGYVHLAAERVKKKIGWYGMKGKK